MAKFQHLMHGKAKQHYIKKMQIKRAFYSVKRKPLQFQSEYN